MNQNSMYRSGSWSRFTDDYVIHSSPKGTTTGRGSPLLQPDELPPYDPITEMANKEKSRMKLAENAVHVIPIVLIICALILWIFSNPDVVVGLKEDSMASKVEGLTIEGDIDNDSDGTQTGFLPAVELVDWDTRTTKDRKYSRKLVKGFN